MTPLLRTTALCSALAGAATGASADGFDVVVLGARGGIQDGNLSAFLVKPQSDDKYLSCDAGSVVAGLIAADAKGAFDAVQVPADSPYTRVGYVLTDKLKGYLISHAHMDHLVGMVAASPDDSKKPIYGLASVLTRIERSYFNWEAWPNFGGVGIKPYLSKYRYESLTPGQAVAAEGTAMRVTAFPLSHSGVESTAFMIESGEDALLCFGDTGPDSVEKSNAMRNIWVAVADKLRTGKLRAIIIEVSFANAQKDEFLFGHLTPKHLLQSLRALNDAAGGGAALRGLPVVISHIKYSLRAGPKPEVQIFQELQADNDLGVRFILPEQGQAWRF